MKNSLIIPSSPSSATVLELVINNIALDNPHLLKSTWKSTGSILEEEGMRTRKGLRALSLLWKAEPTTSNDTWIWCSFSQSLSTSPLSTLLGAAYRFVHFAESVSSSSRASTSAPHFARNNVRRQPTRNPAL